MVGCGWGIPKRVTGVLPLRAQAVPEPSQGHLVDYLRRARGDPRGPLAVHVSQEVEDNFGVHGMDPWPVGAVLQGEVGGHPLSVGHRARDDHRPRAGEVGGESDAGGVLAGSAPRRIRGGVAPGLPDPVLPGGAEPPCVGVSGVPPDVGVAGVSLSTLSALVSPGRTAGWSCIRTSAPAIVLAQDRSAVTCSLSHAAPPRWCTTRCPVSSVWSSSASLRAHFDQVPLNYPSETVVQPSSTAHFHYGLPTVEPLSWYSNKLLSRNLKTAIFQPCKRCHTP